MTLIASRFVNLAWCTVVLLIVGSTLLQAQLRPTMSPEEKEEFKVPDEIDSMLEEFFSYLERSCVKTGFKELLKKNETINDAKGIEILVERTKRNINLYGKISKYEQVDVEVVTPSYIRVRYLVLHAKLPMRWAITYYKSPEYGWSITNMSIDDRSDRLFLYE
jgi:hypothetical protein